MASFVCSCLSAFIRVHPRLLLLVCLGSGGRKEKKWGYELEFCGSGFWTGSGLYGDRGARAGGAAGHVRLRGAGVPERGGAAAAVPGADSVGDSVYGGGGPGGGGDPGQATGGALPPGSGRDGSGEAGGGSVAAGEAGGDPDAGDDHGRPDGDDGPRGLPGFEAGPDHRATVGLAARGFADRPKLPFARKLVEELEAVEVRISPAGNEQYAAWREGTHDDLAFAVALAYWSAQKAYPNGPQGNDRWWTNVQQDDTERMFREWKAAEERRNGHG